MDKYTKRIYDWLMNTPATLEEELAIIQRCANLKVEA